MTDEGKRADGGPGDPGTGAAPSPGEDGGDTPAKRRTPLSEQARNRIAMQLRAMYDTVAQQPVPDRFADLIARLDAADRKGS